MTLPGKTVSIGQYEPPKKDNFGNIIQPEYYYGNGLLVKKVINVKTGDFYYIAKGADHDNNDSNHLQISLDYEGRKNIDLGHCKIKIIPPAGSSTDPNSFDPIRLTLIHMILIHLTPMTLIHLTPMTTAS